MIGYVIRRAGTGDAETILDLLDEAACWLDDRGHDQWQDDVEQRRPALEKDLADATVYVVLRRGEIVGSITLDADADEEIWFGGRELDRALYVHRMVVARDHKGLKIGAAMLDWAGCRAQEAHCDLLRLDAWETNDDLHDYYKGVGFAPVERLRLRLRRTGASFERPAAYRTTGAPTLVDASCGPARLRPRHLATVVAHAVRDLAPSSYVRRVPGQLPLVSGARAGGPGVTQPSGRPTPQVVAPAPTGGQRAVRATAGAGRER